jgi:hypothetical protein
MVISRPSALLLAVGLLAIVACTKSPNALPPGATAERGASTASLPAQLMTPQDLAAQPGGLETVRIAFTLLMDKYYKPVKSADLLQAAWNGVLSEAGKEKTPDTAEAPSFSGDPDADFKSFAVAFDAVSAQGDKAKFGASAVSAMASSLRDDHTSALPGSALKELGGTGPARAARQVFQWRMLSDGIGYMKLSAFPPGYEKLQDGKILAQEVDEALNSFEAKGVTGWVLDLRNDGGGHTESISTIAGRFIASGLQEVDVDSQGNHLEVPFDGHYFAHQHPLAVLINGQSGSAAEITAAALKDYGVARVFGTRSAGAVNGAEIFPLPGNIGLEYTVVQVLAGKTGQPLDKVGVQPDQAVQPSSGSDAPLDAATAWLLGPGATITPAGAGPGADKDALKPEQLESQLSRYGADVKDMPPLPNLADLGQVELNTPNEYVVWAPCTTDAEQLAKTVINRGWQGQYDQFFGNGDPFTYQVSIDLYRGQEGSQQAVSANECPQGFQSATIPTRIGDESAAFKGTNVLRGWTLLRWRRGRAVFSAYYYSEPGLESFDPLVQIARAVDLRYEANPLK